jgi:hypothetical protein
VLLLVPEAPRHSRSAGLVAFYSTLHTNTVDLQFYPFPTFQVCPAQPYPFCGLAWGGLHMSLSLGSIRPNLPWIDVLARHVLLVPDAMPNPSEEALRRGCAEGCDWCSKCPAYGDVHAAVGEHEGSASWLGR